MCVSGVHVEYASPRLQRALDLLLLCQCGSRWEASKQEQSNIDEVVRRSMVEDPEVLHKRK